MGVLLNLLYKLIAAVSPDFITVCDECTNEMIHFSSCLLSTFNKAGRTTFFSMEWHAVQRVENIALPSSLLYANAKLVKSIKAVKKKSFSYVFYFSFCKRLISFINFFIFE